jgi:hypothetical protein
MASNTTKEQNLRNKQCPPVAEHSTDNLSVGVEVLTTITNFTVLTQKKKLCGF